ncbi:MAG: hypothetical protein RBR38_09905 [Desulfomicrobium apsheronum]|nr:hypothetical protein [Desulfomicrobium apsheronum]
MSKLQAFLEYALIQKSTQDSRHLGDRSKYIGASDIAGCPRKAVMSRLHPVKQNAATLMRFARGHAAEGLVDSIFRAGGQNPKREVEVRHPKYPWLRCHIDFLFVGKNGRVHIMELKTTNGIPEAPYASWVNQIHVQMGLLEMSFPDAEIGGSILAVDLNAGQWHEFNNYKPNEILFEHLVEKGQVIKSALDATKADAVAPEPGLLCGYCDYCGTCPAHLDGACDVPEEVEILAQQYLETSQAKKECDNRLKKLKSDIFGFTGTRFKGASDALFIAAFEVGPSEAVDIKALRSRYPEVYEEVKSERAGYIRLDIKPRNAKAA